MLYLTTSTAIGTEVISLRLYPNIKALSEMMSPIIIFLHLFLILFFYAGAVRLLAEGISFIYGSVGLSYCAGAI